jgi:protocatechuate 3,4-dioxygenase beta subunit
MTAAGPNEVSAALEPSVEISGRIVRNGVGIAGVDLFSFSEGDSGSAVTGADGSFTLSNLTPGTIRVNMRKEDEFIQEMRTMTAPARDVVIDLPAGVRVSGRVVDKATRKPVTSFQAGISTSRGGGGMVMVTPPLLQDFTSDDGSFVLENVPSGAVNLVAQAPGYTSARMNLTLEDGKPLSDLELALDTGVRLVGKVTAPDGSALSGASVSVGGFGGPGNVVVLGGEKRATTDGNGEYTIESLSPGEESVSVTHQKYTTTRKSVELKGREVRLDVQLSAGQRVSGVVVTDAGAPVPDAEVEASAAGGSSRRTRADANGAFQFESLTPARYTFSASKTGFAEAIQRDVDITGGAPVRIVLSTGGRIYGTVRGLSEAELAGAVVEARSGMASASATVDPKGNYSMDGAPVGTVRVAATVMGRGFSGRKQSASQTVELSAGGSQQVDLEFRSDTLIRGRILRNGKPLGGAQVSFFPKGGIGSQSNAGVAADEFGNYEVSGLETGEYTVSVIDMQRFSPYTTTYEVRGSATFDIEYETSMIRGRVLDSATGDPIADARVQIRAAGTTDMFRSSRAAATDAGGTFALDSVSPGSYVVTADKDGYGNEVRDVVVSANRTEEVELKLGKNDGVTLNVVDARNGGALNASASVYDQSGRHVQDSVGRFGDDQGTRLRLALSPGTYTATIYSRDYAPRTVTFSSPSTQTVAMTPGGTIRIHSKSSKRERMRLVDANGIPYPRFGTRPPSMELNPSPGVTLLESLAPGSYTIQLGGPNEMWTTVKQVVVGEGQSIDVDV